MLWSNDIEKSFFHKALKDWATKEQLFYHTDKGDFAYLPKGEHSNNNKVLQARNSLIGQFTEVWCKKLLEPVAKQLGLYAINGVICEDIGLTKQSSADLALCSTNNTIQKPNKKVSIL